MGLCDFFQIKSIIGTSLGCSEAANKVVYLLLQSNPVNTDTEGAIQRVHINGVSALSRSEGNTEKIAHQYST